MAKIRTYIATSLDGYIADDEDRLDWLFKYNDSDFGRHDYRKFAEQIRTIVMGRRTYDFLVREEIPWTYGGNRVLVVTSTQIDDPLGPLETRREVDALIHELRALADGDVWLMGGGQLIAEFLEHEAMDELELFVVPEIIGGGVSLFPKQGRRFTPALLQAEALPNGCAFLRYDFGSR